MYKVVIGLEVHCELTTKTKNFSSAPNKFSEYPNEFVATTDLGLPGILPVANTMKPCEAISFKKFICSQGELAQAPLPHTRIGRGFFALNLVNQIY